ncbi:YeeE/YedE family protein [Rhodoferax ferrireducens]|uniref:YeeE/YedE family protein n=1 Tax=Rhodoferax ferrireducens TaxID=192843 RepID=UPI000E0CD19B|nr:YeeE/YedE family protein [Rhodoferax ferrireducens]
MADTINPATLVVWGGFLLAFIFGVVANKTNFCTMGAISDVVNMGHWGRMRMWLLTIAVAMVGANLLYYFGLIDLSKSVYHRPALPWLSLLLGGALFGVGMTIAAGCTNKNLVRLGGGSVRSLVVLVFLAISAYMTLKGLFGQWRASYLDPVSIDVSSPALPQVLTQLTGLPDKTALLATVAMVGLGLLVFVFKDKRFRGNLPHVIGSTVLGLLIVAAWYLTGSLGHGENLDTLETVYFATNTRTLESMSFVAPTAYNLELLMLWTDKSMRVTFGVASVIGVVLGSFAYAIGTRQFRWEGFASLEDLRTQLIGAVLMGFGGVTALGCTIGQGLSGVSTLALGSFVALAGIVGGAVATMKWQQR